MRHISPLLFFAISVSYPHVVMAEVQPAAPLAAGEAGIAWYSRWDTALAESKRSNRPILFQSASAQCNGVPGVF